MELRGSRIVHQSPIFGMLFLDKRDDDKKFMVVVSKKISKKAVDRNKIKRQLFEVLRLNLEKIRPGVRAGFLIRKKFLECKWEEIKTETERALEKLK